MPKMTWNDQPAMTPKRARSAGERNLSYGRAIRNLSLRSLRMAAPAKGTERFRWSDEIWKPSTPALAGLPKRARRSTRIRAYIPVPVSEASFSLDDEAVQAVIDAQDAVKEAQQYADTAGVNTIAQQLLRSEAIASSQIEGIHVPSHRALAKAAAGNQHFVASGSQ